MATGRLRLARAERQGGRVLTIDNPGAANSAPGLERLINLSDGVFAIAITLLAFALRLPPVPPPVTAHALAAALVAQSGTFVTFVISFEVVGMFWLGHHRLFAMVRHFDRGLAMLNLLFLLCIVVIPFSTTLLSDYSNVSTAAVVYAANLVAACAASASTWAYASSGRRLVRPEVDATARRAFSVRSWLACALFGASIGIAVWRPPLAQVSWFVVAAVVLVAERWMQRGVGHTARTRAPHHQHQH